MKQALRQSPRVASLCVVMAAYLSVASIARAAASAPAMQSFGTAKDDKYPRMVSEPDGSAHYIVHSRTGDSVFMTKFDGDLQSAIWTWSTPVPQSTPAGYGLEFIMGVFLHQGEVAFLSQLSGLPDPAHPADMSVKHHYLFGDKLKVRRLNKSTGAFVTECVVDMNKFFLSGAAYHSVQDSMMCNGDIYAALVGPNRRNRSRAALVKYKFSSNEFGIIQVGDSWLVPGVDNCLARVSISPLIYDKPWFYPFACNIPYHGLACGEDAGAGARAVYMIHSPGNITRIDTLTGKSTSSSAPVTTKKYAHDDQYYGPIGLTKLVYHPSLLSPEGEPFLVGIYWPEEKYWTAYSTDVNYLQNCMVMAGPPHLVAIRTSNYSTIWDVTLPVTGGAETFHSLRCPGSSTFSAWIDQASTGASSQAFRTSTANHVFGSYAEGVVTAQHIAFTSDGEIVIAYPSNAQTGPVHHGGFDIVISVYSKIDGSQRSITQVGSAAHDYAMELHVVQGLPYITAMVAGAYGSLTYGGGSTDAIISQVQLASCPPGQVVSGATCGNCSVGFYTISSGAIECLPCAAGNSSLAGSNACFLCPAGSYSQSGGPCELCPIGSFTSNEGSESCVPCPTGRYSNTTGASSCDACSKGEYQDLIGQSSCKRCAERADTDGTGSNSVMFCKCPEGFYGDTAVGESCASCPDSANCPRGSNLPRPQKGNYIGAANPQKVVSSKALKVARFDTLE